MARDETSPLLSAGSRAQDTANFADGMYPRQTHKATGSGNGVAGDEETPNFTRREPEQDPDVARIPGVSLQYIVPAMSVGVLLAAMDNTIVVASYGVIGTDMRELNRTSWISTAYLLTTTSFQPLYGRLSDIFGRKACLIFAYLMFGIGCVLCGSSANMTQLIAARAFTGIGGGGMTTVSSILLSDIVPLRKRGTWQGIINLIFATGSAIGGPLGGWLADTVGWRWAFWGQFPLTLVAVFVVSVALHLPKTPGACVDEDASEESTSTKARLSRVDFPGALTLVMSVFLFLLSLDVTANSTLSSSVTLPILGCSLLLFTAFYFVESGVSAEPFCPPALVKRREIFSPCMANFFSFASALTVIFYIPLYYQAALGTSAATAGRRLLPVILGSVSGSLGAGIFMEKTGKYYWLTALSYLLLFLSSLLVLGCALLYETNVPQQLRIWGFHVGIFAMGVGNGVGVTSTLIALISNVLASEMAVTVAVSYLFRSLGSVLGLSVATALVQTELKNRLLTQLGNGKEVKDLVRRVREGLDFIGELEPEMAAVVRRCYSASVAEAMGFASVMALCAFVASLWIKEVKVKK